MTVQEQMEILKRGAVDFVTGTDMAEKLARSEKTGTPLTVKAGFDPTAPDLHIGHTVLLHKMRQFQDLGHRVVFLIGDFTGMVGDPTGKTKTRPVMTEEEIRFNAETYKAQVFTVLDPELTEVRFNSEWLAGLSAVEMVRLAGRYNVARMMERDDFRTRFKENRSIAIHEFLYPLLQGYDSVALEADVELGGHDQIFNLLVGRDLMKSYGQEPQCVVTVPLLEGLDGVEKMSKSLGNYVGISEPPGEIYGKLMSISDDLMWKYHELLSDRTLEEITRLRQGVADGTEHPRDVKSAFAMEIVARYHGEAAARKAQDAFMQKPVDMEDVALPAENGTLWIARVIVGCGFAKSNGEARRLVTQGAVSIDGERSADPNRELPAGSTFELKVGKRRYARVTLT